MSASPVISSISRVNGHCLENRESGVGKEGFSSFVVGDRLWGTVLNVKCDRFVGTTRVESFINAA